jgi:hypothetical protein
VTNLPQNRASAAEKPLPTKKFAATVGDSLPQSRLVLLFRKSLPLTAYFATPSMTRSFTVPPTWISFSVCASMMNSLSLNLVELG